MKLQRHEHGFDWAWGPVEFNRTFYGFDACINARQYPKQHFAIWYMRGVDCGVYIFGKTFVRRLA